MGVYFTEESKNSFLKSCEMVKKDKRKLYFFLPIYIGIGTTFILLCLLSILIPIWLKDIAELEKLVDQEFSGIRVQSNLAWRDLLQIESDDPTVSWARIRRQTSEEFSNYDYHPDPNTLTTNEAIYDGESRQRQSVYPAEPLSSSSNYNYENYREQKCCCDLQSILTSGNIDQLPVLSQCKTGVKGPPGQKGPVGDPGYDGRPGRPGLDFSFYAGGGSSNRNNFNEPAYPSDDPYAATIINPYSSPPSSSPRYCEPCPPGKPGLEGPKGRPGNPGMKGVTGSSGKHGLPGRAGNRGLTGDMGPPGRHGYGGIPGPNGADGIKGGVGAQGAKGQQGDTGLSGIRGPQGPDGSPGYIGRVGIRGPRGIKGQRGLDGIDGPPGRPGAPGDDGFYCACPPRTSVFSNNNDDYQQQQQNFFPQRPSSAIHSFAQPPRPVATPSSPPAIQPIVQRPFQNRQNPNEFTRKIYINEPTDNVIPIAHRREFQNNNNNRPTSTNIHSSFVPPGSAHFEENNAFNGRNVFTTNRPPPIRNWQTTTEEQTYGLDEDFLNPRKKVLHRHHQIA